MQLLFGFSDEQIEDMPFTRLCDRMIREERRQKSEATTEEQRHRMGLYVQARATVHALTSDKAPPRLKNEKDPTDTELRKAKQWREKHDAAFGDALKHPYHFEELMGYAQHVFSEPPPEAESPQPTSAEERDRLEQEAADNVASMLTAMKRKKKRAGEEAS